MIQSRKHTLLGSLAAITMGGAIFASGLANAQPEATDPAGAEVMTRGPVHEAFAGTVSYDPEAGVIVDQAPPTLIEEVPPEQRLEGENVTWIPGYWAWDEDQNDFLWVSGIWRNLPPGREWVPGYWAETEGRHQWTSGYWEDSKTTEVSYLPEPPRSVEAGPNIEASSNDQTWVPGNWVYRDDRYAWRAGYWVGARGKLVLDTRILPLDPPGLRLCGRLLGLPDRPPRSGVRTGSFPARLHFPAGFLLLAAHGDQPFGFHEPSFPAA